MLQQQVVSRLSVDSVLDTPCFSCLIQKSVSDYHCDPVLCDKLGEYVVMLQYSAVQKPNLIKVQHRIYSR